MMGEILFIAHRIPYPPDRGDKIRSWNIVRKLAEIAPVHIAAFADDARDMGFAPALSKVAASHRIILRDMSRPIAGLRGVWRGEPLSVALFDHPALHAHVAHLMTERPISHVFVYSGQMAQYVPELPQGVRFIMDFGDVDSAKFAAYGREQAGVMGWINRREARTLASYERQVAARADVSLFVSEAEATLFRTSADLGCDRVVALENGVDLDYYNPRADFTPLTPGERGQGPLFVFTGQMDYRPNVEAVDSFARRSLPHIRERHPDARFAIVGRNPAPTVRALGGLPGVVVTGAVADVRGWLAAADIVVAPLRLARGIQNKVLEAMAMARPVILSPQAAEGIDAADDRHFLIAHSSTDEVKAILALLADSDRASSLAAAARVRVEQRYSWRATLENLPDIMKIEVEYIDTIAKVL
ncbi:MAG: TIGR03087 family PEP-CTERM/XrtA system glycosyltransferase [Alphaproteobacteria bacterium]|nr:TIGR03087 family PEP-CTERM/XrtA system glycosyltransferase [Alphaproteobacteria bacterium]